MNCSNCGSILENGAPFCRVCGKKLEYNRNVNMPMPQVNKFEIVQLKVLTNKMRTSATLWMILGVFQILLGLMLLLFCYGFCPIIVGIWNIVQSSTERKNAYYFLENPIGIVNYYETQMTVIIVFLFINLFLGSVIGVIGSIYSLTIATYVKNNRNAFLAIEYDFQRGLIR